MIAINIVRFRVKPGFEEDFVEAHRGMTQNFRGFLGGDLVRTGERTYCFVGQWRGFPSLVDARPQMIAVLDGFRHMLEELSPELGVTDPISGESVVRLAGPAKRKAAPKKKAASKKKAAARKKAPAKRKAKAAKRSRR